MREDVKGGVRDLIPGIMREFACSQGKTTQNLRPNRDLNLASLKYEAGTLTTGLETYNLHSNV
jgi:hypothetical protein